MGKETNIEWCDSTTNPTSGCDGCELWDKHRTVRSCYAGTLHESRLAKSLPNLYAPDFREVRLIPGRMAQAANWPDLRGIKRPDKPWLNGKPRCIFVGDMGDFLSRGVTDEFLKTELIGAITSKNGQRHFWMLLTKRPRRLAEFAECLGGLPDNVMAMTTITTQKTADARIPELLKIRCKWRGISAEPLLGPVDMSLWLGDLGGRRSGVIKGIDWVIVGGESGGNARPCNSSWIKSIVDQCAASGVQCFVKQMGAKPTADLSAVMPEADITDPDATAADIAAWEYNRHNAAMEMKHKKDKKGGDPAEWPADLRVREFPEVAR